jgi:hypothetical protein
LRHVAKPALLERYVYSQCGVEQNGISDADTAAFDALHAEQ